MEPQIISIDASNNVTLSTTSVVPLTQLQQDIVDAQAQVDQATAGVAASQAWLTQAQADLATKQGLVTSATTFQATNLQPLPTPATTSLQ